MKLSELRLRAARRLPPERVAVVIKTSSIWDGVVEVPPMILTKQPLFKPRSMGTTEQQCMPGYYKPVFTRHELRTGSSTMEALEVLDATLEPRKQPEATLAPLQEPTPSQEEQRGLAPQGVPIAMVGVDSQISGNFKEMLK